MLRVIFIFILAIAIRLPAQQLYDVKAHHIQSVSYSHFLLDTFYSDSTYREEGRKEIYNANGVLLQLTETEWVDEGGEGIKNTYFDVHGNPVRNEMEGAAGKYFSTFEYNKTGQLAKRIDYRVEDSLSRVQETHVFKFTPDGKKISEIRFLESEPPDTVEFFRYQNGKMIYHQQWFCRTYYYYDRHDSLQEERSFPLDERPFRYYYFRDAKGFVTKTEKRTELRLLSQEIYARDSSGKLLENVDTEVDMNGVFVRDYNDSGFLTRQLWNGEMEEADTYDSGRLTRRRYYNNDGSTITVEYFYNAKGDCVRIEHRSDNGLLVAYETYEYVYFE